MARKRDEVQPIPAEALAPCDPATVAPLTSEGKPDLYNYMPTRFVPRAEALARGWPLFWEGTVCRYGHNAPRYTSNERLCVDCKREKAGKPAIGGKAAAEWKAPPRKQPETSAAAPSAAVARAPEPDGHEKRFLVALADTRDFDAAAKLVGASPAHMMARLTWSAPFKQAVEELEQRLGIPRTVPINGPFEWDEDKRARLIEVWVDTGDLATALDAIRVTPAEFFRESERNTAFSARLEKAETLANKALEWRAKQLALAGNDKLLTLVLKASDPKYKDTLKVDLNVMERYTDDQLRNRLRQLRAAQGDVIDGEFEVTGGNEPAPASGGAADSGGVEAPRIPQSIRDLL